MADKTKSIKSATDKELDELLIRLRKENNLQDLIAGLKRKSTPNTSYGPEVSYERPEVSTEEPIESLYHYGILGMRWGVRRKRGPDGRVTSKVVSDDHKKARDLKKRAPQGLSTTELRDLNQRLQLERQYSDLSPDAVKKGKTVVKGVLNTGKTVAALYAASQTPRGQQVIKAVRAKIRR